MELKEKEVQQHSQQFNWNPFNGIERSGGARVGLKWDKSGNPFNGIESSLPLLSSQS